MSVVVVNLGLPKSGTTTLAKALRLAGLTVADHRIRGRQAAGPDLKGAFVGELLYRGYFETGDPMSFMPGIQAISEMSMLRGGRSLWPQTDPALIQALRNNHKGLKFIASRREPFAHSQSLLAWSNLGTDRLPQSAVPGLPPGYGQTSKERVQWIEGHHETLCRHFASDPDFLEFHIEDPEAPNRIAAFLGRDLPWWGRLNVNPLSSPETAD